MFDRNPNKTFPRHSSSRTQCNRPLLFEASKTEQKIIIIKKKERQNQQQGNRLVLR
jgi:hypothetical protein